jgi:hypothetical protein
MLFLVSPTHSALPRVPPLFIPSHALAAAYMVLFTTAFVGSQFQLIQYIRVSWRPGSGIGTWYRTDG